MKTYLTFVSLIFSLSLLLTVAGCFPSTVSVSPDGRIAIPREEGIFLIDVKTWKGVKVYEPEKGKEPAWVQWSPKGDRLLYAANNILYICSSDGKNTRTLYKAPSTMGYCLWSPDGRSVSVTEMQAFSIESPDKDEKKPDETGLKGESLPKLKVLDAETGKEKWAQDQISFIHRWLPDSKAIAVFHISKKNKDSGVFSGEISLVDAEKGTTAALAHAQSLESWLDVSPDGRDLYFTSQSASLKKETLKDAEKDGKHRLYRLSLEKKSLDEIGVASIVAVSPDGKKILYLRKQEEGIELVVTDRQGENEKVVARAISLSSSEMGGGKILPVWLNNDELIYWRYVTVLAPDGKALYANIARADGSKTTRAQNLIEEAVLKAQKPK